jgi:hypothetical protein
MLTRANNINCMLTFLCSTVYAFEDVSVGYFPLLLHKILRFVGTPFF